MNEHGERIRGGHDQEGRSGTGNSTVAILGKDERLNKTTKVCLGDGEILYV